MSNVHRRKQMLLRKYFVCSCGSSWATTGSYKDETCFSCQKVISPMMLERDDIEDGDRHVLADESLPIVLH